MNTDIKEALEKLKKWFFLMPAGTKTIFITILSLYILKLFWSGEVEDTCINPEMMWSHIITSLPRYILHSFVHASILHIVFNSIALIHFSSNFEKNVGSVLLVYIVLVFSVLIAVIYSFTAEILSIMFISKWVNTCTIGISGVLFSFITIESLQNETIKHIRGMEIPSKYNPWILLVFTQIFWPKASFLGHLSGIAVGYLYYMGVLDKIMLEHSAIYSIEQSLPFNLSSFIVHNGGATLPIFNGQRTGNDHEYAHLNEEFDDIFPPEDDLPAVSIIDDEENPSVGTPLVNGLINDNNQSNQPSTPLLNGLINDSNQSSTPLLNGLINDTNRPTTPLLDGLINNSNQGEQINNNSTENAKTTN
jgi:membrane associated rhomboid family serine protease